MGIRQTPVGRQRVRSSRELPHLSTLICFISSRLQTTYSLCSQHLKYQERVRGWLKTLHEIAPSFLSPCVG